MNKLAIEQLDWIYLNESSTIYRMYYDDLRNTFYIEFKSNLKSFKKVLYIHRDVPKDIFNKIKEKFCFSISENIPSHGATYDQLIKKNPKYEAPEKIEYF